MRRPAFDSRRSATMVLLIANVVAFVLECIYYRYPPLIEYGNPVALSWQGLRHGQVWQLITFQFMHAGIWHLVFNCWSIFVFGRELEATLGVKRFLTLYFSSGIIGGLVQALAGGMAEHYARTPWGLRFEAPTVGASAGALGLIAAYAMLFPERQLMMLPIPIMIRAKILLLFTAAFAVFSIIVPMGSTADAAHLGGMLTGVLFIRYAIHWEWHWPQLRRTGRQPPRRLVRVPTGSSASWGRTRTEGELPPDEFLSKEVDPILDKISAHGIQSLTDRERRILEAAREKMSRR